MYSPYPYYRDYSLPDFGTKTGEADPAARGRFLGRTAQGLGVVAAAIGVYGAFKLTGVAPKAAQLDIASMKQSIDTATNYGMTALTAFAGSVACAVGSLIRKGHYHYQPRHSKEAQPFMPPAAPSVSEMPQNDTTMAMVISDKLQIAAMREPTRELAAITTA